MLLKKNLSSDLLFQILILLSVVSIPCGATRFQTEGSHTKNSTNEENAEDDLKKTIEGLLSVQTQAWNDGDLEKFMTTYWKSDKLSFSSGGQTTFGWQATLDRYKRGYAPPKEMGKLNFDNLIVSPIEANSVLVLGNWHLKMKDDSRRDGNFSLVIKRIEGKWKIIHDHSSIKSPEKDDSDEQ